MKVWVQKTELTKGIYRAYIFGVDEKFLTASSVTSVDDAISQLEGDNMPPEELKDLLEEKEI